MLSSGTKCGCSWMIVTSLPQRPGWSKLAKSSWIGSGAKVMRITEEKAKRITSQEMQVDDHSLASVPESSGYTKNRRQGTSAKVKDHLYQTFVDFLFILSFLINIFFLPFGKSPLFYCIKAHWDCQSKYPATLTQLDKGLAWLVSHLGLWLLSGMR